MLGRLKGAGIENPFVEEDAEMDYDEQEEPDGGEL